MKRCNRCRREKPLAEFHRNRSSADGYCRDCAACARKRAALWYSRNLLRRAQYETLRYARRALDRSIRRAEELA